MTKAHLKRIACPRTWDIQRKAEVFITRPKPGGCPIELCMPINVIMRDILGVCKDNKEVKYVVFNKEVKVNRKRIKDIRRPLGIFDTISIDETKLFRRMSINEKGKLVLIEIKQDEADKKLCKITGKKQHKGKLQLNLNDGSNIFVEKDEYKVNDSVLLKLPEKKIIEHLKFEKGNIIILLYGQHIGITGKLEEIDRNKIIFKNAKGKAIQTVKPYAFVIGKDKPLIKVEEK